MSVDMKIETKYGSYDERNLSALIRRNMMTKEQPFVNFVCRRGMKASVATEGRFISPRGVCFSTITFRVPKEY